MTVDVRPFTPEELYGALSSAKASATQVAAHEQARYLYRYLKDLEAKCIVLEKEYTDGDYLDDYANYYAKSHELYERKCVRLHFFSTPWTAVALGDALRQQVAPSDLQASYLGFVVGRPLPEAIIGRTVLATYPPDNGRRHYPTTRKYTAHLLGTPLTVKSLAFQEQDTVLAACATVALWSAFQKTSELFNTAMPTPVEITRAANSGILSSRVFPSRGLGLPQMARAVQQLGLEPEVFECSDRIPLLSLLAGYVDLGIPPILLLDINGRGGHAVAVSGYSLRDTPQHSAESRSATLFHGVGRRIDELYVHDDGHGPFARIKARARATSPANESVIVFDGPWSNPAGGPAMLKPEFVLVPLYHKIRLNFFDLQQWLTYFTAIALPVLPRPAEVEWITSLTDTNSVKALVKDSKLPTAEIDRVIRKAQPRFIWRALMRVDGQSMVEVLFDATGMRRSQVAFDMLWYNDAFKQLVIKMLGLATVTSRTPEPIVEFLRAQLTPASP